MGGFASSPPHWRGVPPSCNLLALGRMGEGWKPSPHSRKDTMKAIVILFFTFVYLYLILQVVTLVGNEVVSRINLAMLPLLH